MNILIAMVITYAITRIINWIYWKEEGEEKEEGSQVGIKKAVILVIIFSGLTYWDGNEYKLYKMTELIFLLIITITDIEKYKIYDVVTMPFALTGIIFAEILGYGLEERIIGGLCGGIYFYVLKKLTKEGIGGGDVKLIAAMGMWNGYEIIDIVINGSILGGICALVMLLSGKKGRKDVIAYGPYFCIAGVIEMVN